MTGWTSARPPVLVPLQAGTTGPAIFCFHAFGGSAAIYGDLAYRLGSDHPVYGLQAVGLTPGCAPDTTVSAMAHRYADAIAATASPGTCLFVGYSMGGLLALETARMLQDAGHVIVPTLVAVDCDPTYTPSGPPDPWRIVVREVLDLDLEPQRLATLPRLLAVEQLRAAASKAGKLPSRFSLDRLACMVDTCWANERAATDYRPGDFPGTVHVLRMVDCAASRPPEPECWAEHAARVLIHQVAGTHHNVLTPAGYDKVAAVLRGVLAEFART